MAQNRCAITREAVGTTANAVTGAEIIDSERGSLS